MLPKSLPRHHVRVPDERARLRADEGHARVARVRGGAGARGRRPDPVQHLLDPRVGGQPVHRPPRRGQAAEVRGPGAGGGRGRLLGAVGEGRGLRALPVRGRRLRPGADPQAGRVPDRRTRSPRRATSSSRASPATCRRSASASSRAGCRSPWAATASARTASSLDPRARGQPRPGRAGRGGRGAGGRRRARGDAARAERELLRPRPADATSGSRSPSCWAASTRSRASTGSATRARIRRTCART